MDAWAVTLLNGLNYGLLLFMLSAGLTLTFGMMGVVNFAHASFYMLGAYLAHTVSARAGFGLAVLVAPLAVALLGGLFQSTLLRRAQPQGHAAELLMTFGLAYVVVEVVQLVWGRGPVDYRVPAALDWPLFTVNGWPISAYRVFGMAVALAMLGTLALWLRWGRTGWLLRAALTHPHTLQALGHNVPRLFTWVFAGGAGLAGLAGVIGGNLMVTEPGMAATIGSVVFVVVVVGGLGSLSGALLASLGIGVLQTFAVAWDWDAAPVLPYALMVAVLALRPQGLLGRREGAWQ